MLCRGTATRFVQSILSEGLMSQDRQHVHLSIDEATAQRAGQRHGKPYIFRVDTIAMQTDGFKFYQAGNGVWLTDQVPARFLTPVSEPEKF